MIIFYLRNSFDEGVDNKEIRAEKIGKAHFGKYHFHKYTNIDIVRFLIMQL